MGKIISVHSFRGGTGKSNITANIGYSLAAKGKRVCIIDTDVQSPGIHVPLQLLNHKGATLNDFLFNNVDIKEVAVDISSNLDLPDHSLFFIPSSINTQAITKILKEGYNVSILGYAFSEIQKKYDLDYLLIDTHPGLNEETLLSIAMSDILYIVMRPDEQDFQGTSVTVDIANKLNVKNISIIVNMVAPSFNTKQVKKEVFNAFGCNIAEVLPHTYKLTELASSGLYCKQFPNDEWSRKIKNIVNSLL
jgi:septum site-determining protein MinD